MKGNTKAKNAQEYIDSLQGERKEQIIALDTLIREIAPKLEPVFMSGMLGYGTYHYKYKSGKEGDWFVIGLASQKNYISLYACMCDGDEYLTEKYKSKLGKVKTGKSCIKFTTMDDIDIVQLKSLLQDAEKLAIEKNFTYMQ